MGHRLYEVPIIQQDLRHEEAIIQIADSLEYLNRVVNDVFNRIESRIESNQTRLDKLHTRASVTRSKVEKLTGSNKATKVFSSAKYPATEIHKDYKSSFVSHVPLVINRCPEKIRSKHLPSEGKVLQEKLQFYHVKVSNSLLRRNIEIAPEEGLGSLPRDLDSISSLLLFNTSENPYKRYVMLDPLGAITKTRQGLEEEDDHRMEAAPITISQQEQLERQAGENYFYSPGLGQVPQIDVPLDLPDLPGVADDLRYCMDIGPIIAPSVSTTPAIPELPSLVPETPTSPTVAPPPPQTSTSTMHHAPPPPPFPPPPPPPPLPPLHPPLCPPPPPPPPFTPRPTSSPPPPPPFPPALPPPFPPPSLGRYIPTVPVSANTDMPKKEPVVKSTDARAHANLMEAIRQAGGSENASLKSAEEKKQAAKKQKLEEKATAGGSTGGDFMADLHAKLSMRRKGISGAVKSPELAVMERLKTMIPPPPPPMPGSYKNDGDSDWEEEDEDK